MKFFDHLEKDNSVLTHTKTCKSGCRNVENGQ